MVNQKKMVWNWSFSPYSLGPRQPHLYLHHFHSFSINLSSFRHITSCTRFTSWLASAYRSQISQYKYVLCSNECKIEVIFWGGAHMWACTSGVDLHCIHIHACIHTYIHTYIYISWKGDVCGQGECMLIRVLYIYVIIYLEPIHSICIC